MPSITTIRNVWEHSQHSGSALLLLLAISDFANDDGLASVSLDALSKKIRMTRRYTQKLLAQIAATGEITININGGRHLYHVRVGESGTGFCA